MNEHDLDLGPVRAVLDDVPAASQARLAAGRTRLLAAMADDLPGPQQARPRRAAPRRAGSRGRPLRGRPLRGRPLRGRRSRWVIVPAAAAAAVTAFVLAGGGAGVPRPAHPAAASQHPAGTGQATPASLAAKVLTAAARTVATEPSTEPAPGQWIYYQSVAPGTGNPGGGVDNEWITFDGTQSAYYGSPSAGAPAQLIVHHEPAAAIPTISPGTSALDAWDANAVPLTAYNALASLPASPAALLAAVDAQLTASGETEFGVMGSARTAPQKEFAYLGVLLWNAYAAAPPSALAAVYQAIATLPGVTVRQGATDAAGHAAIGVSDNGGATELLLDPHTYQVAGINLWSGVPKGPGGKPKGTGGWSKIAYLRIAEVSGPGQR